MFTFQVDKTFQQFMKMFDQLGIWPSDDESNFRKTGKKLFYTFFGALFPIFFLINACLCEDRNESLFSVQLSVQTAVVYVKLLNLIFKKQQILAFLNDQIVVHSIENRVEYEKTHTKMNKFIRFVRSYYFATYITFALIICMELPIFSADRTLPLFISFSWNDSEVIYWLAYLFMSLSALLYVSSNLITPFIWYIMLNCSIEYQLLGNKLRILGLERSRLGNQKNLRSAPRSMFAEDLNVLMKAHRNLIGTIERFRSCFSTLFLVQITTSGFSICFSVYNLAFVSQKNMFQVETNVIIVLYGVFDIFLVMYLGNEITTASDLLSYCLFESNWLEQTESSKKCVLIMGEVLKQPQRLVILIYPVNLEAFMTIVNGTYRMFNILKNFQ